MRAEDGPAWLTAQIWQCKHRSEGKLSTHDERKRALGLGERVRRDPHDLASWVNKIE